MGEQGGRVVYTQPGGIPTICCMSSHNWLHLASAGWQTLLPWPSTVLHLPAPHHPAYWLQETLGPYSWVVGPTLPHPSPWWVGSMLSRPVP